MGSPGNNWVHSPERNFEFSSPEFIPQEGTRERRNETPDFSAEPQSEIPTIQGIVLRNNILGAGHVVQIQTRRSELLLSVAVCSLVFMIGSQSSDLFCSIYIYLCYVILGCVLETCSSNARHCGKWANIAKYTEMFGPHTKFYGLYTTSVRQYMQPFTAVQRDYTPDLCRFSLSLLNFVCKHLKQVQICNEWILSTYSGILKVLC